MKKLTAFFLISIILIGSLRSQTFNQDVDVVLDDLLIVFDGFSSPAARAGIQQTTAGYYSRADTLKLFQVKFGAGASILPFTSEKRLFTIEDSQFRNLNIKGGSSARIPTALGGREEIDLEFTLGGERYPFEVFGGLDTDELYLPYLQGSIGFWANTELTIRYAPQIEVDGSEYALYGAAVRHNLTQYFAKDSKFQISALVNFSWTDLNLEIDTLELVPNNSDEPLAVLDGLLIDLYSINGGLVSSYKLNNWFYLTGGLTGTIGWVDYRFTGLDTRFFRLFNDTLTQLSEKKYSIMGDVGITADLKYVELIAQFSYSDASNFNLGLFVKI
jgi:hypothetical protein